MQPLSLPTALSVGLLTLAVSTVSRAEGPPVVAIPALDRAIELDGKDADEAWKTATAIDGFTPFEPSNQVNATFQVEGKALQTDNSLYLFLRVEVPANQLKAPFAPRDSGGRQDRVTVQVDPYRDGRVAFAFTVTPSGVLTDGLIRGDREAGDLDKAWNSLFDAATDIQPGYWTAEIRIPFQSLRFHAGETDFNMHIFAYGWKAQQALSWAPIDRDATNYLSQMGTLSELKDPKPGRALEFVPSLTAAWGQTDGDIPDCSVSSDAFGNSTLCGVDTTVSLSTKWAINTGNTVDLTWNPDFSQIEADPRQLSVNNRFALQLDERRPFFLEGMDLFEISFLSLNLLDRDLEMVYTRSINQPVFAAKLTGRADRTRYGLMIAYDQTPPDSVIDDRFSSERAPEGASLHSMTSIARVVQNIGKRGALGVIAVDKEYLDGSELGGGTLAGNRIFGVDSQVFFDPRFSMETAALFSHSKPLEGDEITGYAGRARLLYKADAFRLQTHYEGIHRNFRSEAGFIPRTGFHNVFQKMDFFYRSESNWARVLSPGAYASVFLAPDGELAERIVGVNHYWKFGHQLVLFPEFERISEIAEGRLLDTTQSNTILSWRGIPELELTGSLRIGETVIREQLREPDQPVYVGFRTVPSLSATVYPTPRLKVRLSHFQGLIYNRYGGELLANQPVSRLDSQYFFTRSLSLRLVGEWDQGDDEVSGDLLVSYQPSPATLVFFGYREENAFGAEDPGINRTVFAKFSYLFAY